MFDCRATYHRAASWAWGLFDSRATAIADWVSVDTWSEPSVP